MAQPIKESTRKVEELNYKLGLMGIDDGKEPVSPLDLNIIIMSASWVH